MNFHPFERLLRLKSKSDSFLKVSFKFIKTHFSKRAKHRNKHCQKSVKRKTFWFHSEFSSNIQHQNFFWSAKIVVESVPPEKHWFPLAWATLLKNSFVSNRKRTGTSSRFNLQLHLSSGKSHRATYQRHPVYQKALSGPRARLHSAKKEKIRKSEMSSARKNWAKYQISNFDWKLTLLL